MTKILARWRCDTLEELAAVLAELQATTADRHPSTVYLKTLSGDGIGFATEESTLSDGSTAVDIVASI